MDTQPVAQNVEIRLLGERIALKSGSDPELVQQVVELVNGKLSEAEKRRKNPAPHHVAVLALLDLAGEYVQARRRAEEHQQKLEDKSKELFSLLETEFK